MKKIVAIFICCIYATVCFSATDKGSKRAVKAFLRKNKGISRNDILLKYSSWLQSVKINNSVPIKDFSGLKKILGYGVGLTVNVYPGMDFSTLSESRMHHLTLYIKDDCDMSVLSVFSKSELSDITIYVNGSCDLSILSKFNNIKTLTIYNLKDSDIGFIPKVHSLKYLNLYSCHNLTGFPAFKASMITNLRIEGYTPELKLSDLWGMRLKHLHLDRSKIKNTNSQNITNIQLRSLSLNYTGISDISILEGMKLEALYLSGLPIEDISVLEGMPLKRLALFRSNKVKSIMPLKDATDLTSLSCPKKLLTIESIRMLKTFSKLTCINGKKPEVFFADIDAKESKESKESKEISLEKEIAKIKTEIKINFDDIKKALALIENRDGGSGSGFIVKDFDGQHYLYTNQHVIQGVDKFSVRTIGNQKLTPKGFQISDNRDIVRFKLDSEQKYPNALEFAKSATNEEPIVVFGNSGGGGVFTSIYGRIVGVGPDRIEVSAEFIPGNSGSPILDNDGKVVGIATYATKRNTNADWTVKGTRFADVRRFAYRVDPNMKWVTMKWKKYQNYAKMIEDDKEYMEDVFKLTVRWINTPYNPLPGDSYKQSELKRWLSVHNLLAKKIQKATSTWYIKASKKDSINKTAKSYTRKSTISMAEICRKKAKNIRNRVKKSKKVLTTYLKKNMLENADILDGMAKEIEKYGGELCVRNAVQYRQ